MLSASNVPPHPRAHYAPTVTAALSATLARLDTRTPTVPRARATITQPLPTASPAQLSELTARSAPRLRNVPSAQSGTRVLLARPAPLVTNQPTAPPAHWASTLRVHNVFHALISVLIVINVAVMEVLA